MPEKCIKDHVASADVSVAHQPPNQTKLTKMKSMILVALALVAAAAAAPAEEPIKTLRSEFDQQPGGSYVYGYETENGIIRQETGEVKSVPNDENKPQDVVIVRGSYSYPGEDGKPITIEYFADQNGYHAEGSSIPKVASR